MPVTNLYSCAVWSVLLRVPPNFIKLFRRNDFKRDALVRFISLLRNTQLGNAQNPLHTFPRYFPVDGEVANLLPAFWQQIVVMEFGKQHDTTDTTDFCPRPFVTVTGLLRTCLLCCGLAADLLSGSRQLLTDRTCYGETAVMDFGLNETLHSYTSEL